LQFYDPEADEIQEDVEEEALHQNLAPISCFTDFILMQQLMTLEVDIILG